MILLCDTDVVFPCSVLFEHQGLSSIFYSGTQPVMHCHGHAHTPMRETRKDTFFFFCSVDDSAAAPSPTSGVNACFLCACRAVCFDLDALDPCCFFVVFFFILAI